MKRLPAARWNPTRRIAPALEAISPLAPESRNGATCDMLIAWTAVGTAADADRLAAEIISAGLAACVQIDGPIISHFRWEGKNERAEEFRLCIKLTEAQLAPLKEHVLAAHPYDTPEWLVTPASDVGEKYLSWAKRTVHSPPL